MGRQSFIRVLQAVAIAAVLACAGPVAHAQVTWTGTTSTSWSDGANWSTGSFPTTGSLAFGFDAPNQPSNNSTTGTYNLLNFLNSSLGSSLTLGGTGTLTLSAATASGTTISNLNTTAGRTVTIQNNLVLSNAQTWSSEASANAITIISGNLSGSGTIMIVGGVLSTGTQQPNFRLTGSNSGYTGTIFTGTRGVLLDRPDAMTGGLISITGTAASDTGSLGRTGNLWLTGGSGTYTFGIEGTGATGARVQFNTLSGNRSAGILLTGGDVYWNPGGQANFDWSGPAGATGSFGGNIQVGGGDAPTTSAPYRLFLGQQSGTFTISGGDKNIGGGNSLNGRVTLLSALGSGTDTTARTLQVAVPVLTLSAAAVSQSGTLNVTVGGTSTNWTSNSSGLEISNVNQLPNGNLILSGRFESSIPATPSGVLILNNMGSTFDRPYGTGAGQWQLSGPNVSGSANWAGFAATGSNATIPNTLGASVFDRNFALGYSLRNPNGTLYADKGVTIAQDTTLTDTRLVSVANNGMNFYGLSGSNTLRASNVLNELSGNLSGTGALVVLGQVTETNATQNDRGILVLSGSNSWTGAPVSSLALGAASVYFNAGPGGLIAQQSFVRFARPESLPTGASSGTSYLVAVENGRAAGLLVTGGTATQTYDLSDNYRFLLGSNRGASIAANALTSFGADGGKATVKGSSLLLNGTASTHAMGSSFIVLNGSELTLGTGTSNAEAFNLIPSSGFTTNSGSSASYVDATGNRSLFKFGEGTLVLGNVRYTDLALSGTDKSSQFAWQIGSGNAAPWLDGAVRGLSMSAAGANKSNSLQGFYVAFAGGVYEVDTLGTSGTLAATLGTAAVSGTTILNLNNTGGGGFSAFGGNVQVILNSGSSLIWNNTSGFASNNVPLLFGSQTADAVVTLTNNISLNTNATREIRVFDNSGTSSDYAVLSGTLSSSANLNKTGPGLLELQAANTFTGTATVSAGTLRLANNQALQSAILNTSGTGLVAMSEIVTTPTFGGLVGSGNLSTVFGSSYSTLTSITLNRTGIGTGTSTYTAAITDGASGMAITKSGTGVQELTGANSYTGTTTITAGTLRLGIANLPGNIANSAGLEILQASVTTGTASGVISGTGSLTMINGGVVRLANTANTYTGVTTISSGVLEVAALANAGSDSPLGAPIGGNATIGLGSSTASGTLNYVGSGAASTNRSFNLLGNGGIAANGGDALAITGTVTGAGAQVFTLSGTSTALNSLPSINGGSGVSVIKSGPGTWQLTGNSSYSGQLQVLDGRLIVGSVASTGASPFGGDANILPLVGDSSATSGTAALLVASGTVARGLAVNAGSNQVVILGGYGAGLSRFSGGGPEIRLGRDVTLQASNGGTVEFASTWLDSAGGTSPAVNFTIGSLGNDGTVVFAGSVPASIQSVNVVVGTLAINNNNRIGFGTPMTLGSASSNGTFDLRSFSQRLASLTFTGVGSTVSSTAAGTLRLFNGGTAAANVNVLGTGVAHQISAPVALDDNSTFNVASAAKLAVSGLISNGTNGARNLTKTGLGTLELSGANNFTGLTTVEQGSLAVNGLLGPGGLSVLAGATLMGSGTIGGDATIAGIHSPGNSPGIETFSGNLTYAGGLSQVIWELWDNTDAAGSRGTAYDGIDVTGTLNFDGATSLILSFGGSGTGSVDWESSFWSESKEWRLYSVSGTTTNFNNFTLSSNPSSWIDSTGTSFASSTRSGGSFQVVQQGSNILLQYVVVPEPAAITLAFIGIAAAAYAARRRR